MNEQSYILEYWEKWESEAEKHPPKYCPNCGAILENIQEYWTDSSRISSPANPFKSIGYDCYCKSCKWSGDIECHADLGIVDETYRKASKDELPHG